MFVDAERESLLYFFDSPTFEAASQQLTLQSPNFEINSLPGIYGNANFDDNKFFTTFENISSNNYDSSSSNYCSSLDGFSSTTSPLSIESYDSSSSNTNSSIFEDYEFEKIAEVVLESGVEPKLQSPEQILEEIQLECEQISKKTKNQSNKAKKPKKPRKITIRKRGQNREASLKYRKRKKYEKVLAEVEIDELLAKNQYLQDFIEKVSHEISYYRSLTPL